MGHPGKGKARGRFSKHWECSSCHYFVPVKDSFCNSCGEFRSITPSPKGKGRGHEPKGQGRGKQPQSQPGIAERQLRQEHAAAAKENVRLQKENQRLKAEADKLAKAGVPPKAALAEAEPAEGEAVNGADAIDLQIQKLSKLLSGTQSLDEDMRDMFYPNEGDHQAKVDDLKRQLEALRTKKREKLPASQQLQKAQGYADKVAKRLENAKSKQAQLLQTQRDLQQQLVEADADIVKLTAESAAAAESVRTVSLQAAAAAAHTSSQADATPVSIVVPNEIAEGDPKLRECLEYLNGHKAMQSAILSPSIAMEPAAHRPPGTEAAVEQMVAEGNAAHVAQLQQELERYKAQALEVRQLWADMDDDLASDIESVTDQGEHGATRRPRKTEHTENRKAKRKKLGGVISRFDKS